MLAPEKQKPGADFPSLLTPLFQTQEGMSTHGNSLTVTLHQLPPAIR